MEYCLTAIPGSYTVLLSSAYSCSSLGLTEVEHDPNGVLFTKLYAKVCGVAFYGCSSWALFRTGSNWLAITHTHVDAHS